MAADNAPLSFTQGPGRWGDRVAGLDRRIAEAAAAALGRPLRLLPFESEYEKESSLTHEVGALLASGRCDAISGFPLMHGDIGSPTRPSAREPDTPGAVRKPLRPFVPLAPTAASRPYIGAALGLVSRVAAPGANGAPSTPPASLQALARTGDAAAPAESGRIGVTAGTLAGTYGMLWQHGVLKPRLVTVGQREDLLDRLAGDAPGFGHALVPLTRFDGWRLAHPQLAPRLVASAWRKPLGVNLGFLLPADQAEARAALDRVIGQALADGALARWAAEAGVSWAAPTEPAIAGGLGLAALLAD